MSVQYVHCQLCMYWQQSSRNPDSGTLEHDRQRHVLSPSSILQPPSCTGLLFAQIKFERFLHRLLFTCHSASLQQGKSAIACTDILFCYWNVRSVPFYADRLSVRRPWRVRTRECDKEIILSTGISVSESRVSRDLWANLYKIINAICICTIKKHSVAVFRPADSCCCSCCQNHDTWRVLSLSCARH
jgi:hypothetical protein